MNKATLYTIAKKFEINDDLFIVSVYDLEPAGIIVHAYNQIDSKEYMLPISERELSGLGRDRASLEQLISTISLVRKGMTIVLESSNINISKIKKRPTGDELEGLLKTPMMGEDSDSIQELLVTGLMELCKVKPSGNDAIQWIGDWLIANNPNKPNVIDPDDL